MTRHRPAHPSFPTHSRSGGLNRELQPQVDKTKNISIVTVIHLNQNSHIWGKTDFLQKKHILFVRKRANLTDKTQKTQEESKDNLIFLPES